MEQTPLPSPPQRDVYTVSRLNREAKALLEGSFPPIWIEGEVSNLSRPNSGHIYFSLKDENAQIRCAFFRPQQRLPGMALSNGLQVLARGRISLYEGRGDFQIIIDSLEAAGEGALRRAFDALKQRLLKEGLFDTTQKKPIPRFSHQLGVITSPSGSVLHDILTTLRRRFPAMRVLIYPVPVQGEGAAEKIAEAIHLADRRGECDALILARGGGSLEDLWAFNEEIVARAIYSCSIPIVSGIGHETDFTIADMVADARAPTPTAAAELLSPDQFEWQAHFARFEQRLMTASQGLLRYQQQRLDWLSARLVHPKNRIAMIQQKFYSLGHRLYRSQLAHLHKRDSVAQKLLARLIQLSPRPSIQSLDHSTRFMTARLISSMNHQLKRAATRTQQLMQSLNTLSPLATLGRGYAIVQQSESGVILSDARKIKPGDRVTARLAHGRLECRVDKTHHD